MSCLLVLKEPGKARSRGLRVCAPSWAAPPIGGHSQSTSTCVALDGEGVASCTPCVCHGRRRGPDDIDTRASGARHRSDRPGRERRDRPTPRRGRAGSRAHASIRDDGDAVGERRGGHRRSDRARVARRRTGRGRHGLPRLDRPAGDAPAVVERLATDARRVVFLSAPHNIEHPFFQQPNPMAVLYAEIEGLIAASGLESTIIRPGMFASNALTGGRPRSEPTTWSGGRTALPRRHLSMIAT